MSSRLRSLLSSGLLVGAMMLLTLLRIGPHCAIVLTNIFSILLVTLIVTLTVTVFITNKLPWFASYDQVIRNYFLVITPEYPYATNNITNILMTF